MPKNKIAVLVLALMLTGVCAAAQEGQQEPPKPEELAAKETERLERELGLEDWQTFYVDSTLNYNYTHLFKELEGLQRSMVSNSDLYIAVQDKWMEKTEAAYRKFFNEEQWKKYLKQGGQRIIDDRQKRRMKAAGIKPEKKKKKNKK